jgi:hypothetical protein
LANETYYILSEDKSRYTDYESDPILANVKLIAEAWDAAGLYRVGSFVGDSWNEWWAVSRRCQGISQRRTTEPPQQWPSD